MKIKKFSSKKGVITKKMQNAIPRNISLKFFLLDFSLLIVILTLAFNIFIAYKEGMENLEKLQEEESKLLKLQEDNAKLMEEENYYRSIEFRKAYAKESLNLSGQGETLYYVQKEEKEETEDVQILFKYSSTNNIDRWRLLLFGD